MGQKDIGVIDERIARLEREARVWRRGTAAMMVLLGILIALTSVARTENARASGADTRKLVVRKITVVDRKGRPRIELEIGKYGAALRLLDGHGKNRSALWVGKDGPGLTLSDGDGTPRAFLAVQKSEPQLMLFDKKMSPAAVLAVSKEDGSPGLYLTGGHASTPSVRLEANKVGPALGLHDENGRERAYLHVVEGEGPALEFRDENGKLRANYGVVELEAAHHGVTEDTGPGSITLYGKDGKKIWKAP
jgi:hypothetical protein